MSFKTLSFSLLGKYGRLGNQLFQISSTIGLSEKHKLTASFPVWQGDEYFATPIPKGQMHNNQIKEIDFSYHEWNIPNEGADIKGYLQSSKYFAKNAKEQFKFKPQLIERLKNKYEALFSKEVICIHIRRGDYITNPNYFKLTPIYYIGALLKYFPNYQDYNILILSDDVPYCKVHFECMPNVFFADNNNEFEDLCLATLCNHFILSNSTFSWWCAYLGESKGSVVVRPHKHFEDIYNKSDKDLWQQNWVIYEQQKLDIDATFIIPVFYDHPDRLKNLQLTLCMLQKDFNAEYIITEEQHDKFKEFEKWAIYRRCNNGVFHRTKMLNEMALMATKRVIFNFDADIILPPMQIIECIRIIKDFCYPYDGRFARMPREFYFKKIEESLDIGVVRNDELKGKNGRELPVSSVGGVVAFTRNSYIDSGMENEKFISFSPEDVERWERYHKLEYDVKRVKGALYHINHFVGVTSSPLNPYYDAAVKELDKLRKMSKDEMRRYIDTWSWRHPYTNEYYQRIVSGSIMSAKEVYKSLPFVPDSVIDVGCGVGAWHQPNQKYIGIDFNVDKVLDGVEYINIDLSKPFELNGKYDLALCLEVAEHLPESAAANLIEQLCKVSDNILFSAAIPKQGGTGHINEQWQSYWYKIFKDNGFGAAKKQPNIRKNKNIELWYRQNIVLYKRGENGRVEDFILPEYYEQITSTL